MFSAVLTVMLTAASCLTASDPSHPKKPVASELPVPRPHPTTEERSCFDDNCRCFGKTADCSHNYGRLTYVPKLPNNIRILIFSFNNLTRIQSYTFKEATTFFSIDLRNNGLEHIHPRAFETLRKLRILYLDYNHLSYNTLLPAFSARTLRKLYVRHMNLGPLPNDYFSRQPMPRLTMVDLSGNRIQHLNFSVFVPLLRLTEIGVESSRVFSTTTDYLPLLTRLNLNSSALFDLPETCRNGSSLFPKLRGLTFRQNSLSGFYKDICLPKLVNLDMGENPISVIETDMFNGNRFPSLRSLSLESVASLQTIEKFAFRHPTLLRLSVMYSNIRFSNDPIDPDAFAGAPNLSVLEIGHNLGSYISEQKFSRLFGSLASLEELYMGNFGIQSINTDTFSNLTRLTTLYLYRNKLTDIPDGAFDSLHNLTVLVLNENQLQTVRDSMLCSATRKRLRHLDFSGNPFLCDCYILWFQKWFVSSPSLFNSSYGNYTCSNNPNTLLKSFVLNEQACYLRIETYRALIVCVVIFIFGLSAVSTLYQYRWHIRLMLAFRGHRDIMRKQLRAENFAFDIFVSCAEEDETWVLQHLLPQLEGRLRLRLCFHKRDFVPGKAILNNIVDCVKTSKKFMMIFSKHFAQSRWCQFELDLCLGHVLDNEGALIVTCLDDVASRDLTRTMMAVLSTTTYIQWEQNPYVRASFWNRLELSLKDVILEAS